MKKKFISAIGITLLAGISTVNAQTTLRVRDIIDPNHSGTYDRNRIMDGKKSLIEGTPYANAKYEAGSIAGVQDLLMMRYNAVADEIEIQDNDEKTYILPKKEEFNLVDFKMTKIKYRLLNYINPKDQSVFGYLAELGNANGAALLKRENIKLQEGTEAANSYDMDRPAKYIKGKPDFYLQQKDKKVIPFPKSKKALQDLYPAQKDAINAFFKANDYSFKEENDMKAITNFIGTL